MKRGYLSKANSNYISETTHCPANDHLFCSDWDQYEIYSTITRDMNIVMQKLGEIVTHEVLYRATLEDRRYCNSD
jgi:hypothetical protein